MATKNTRGNMRRRQLVSGVVGVVMLCAFVACGASEPMQSVRFKQRLTMEISQQWVPMKASGKKASYKLGDSKDIRLSFEDQTRDYGTPMTLQSVRSAVGSELNSAYGKVDARLSYAGNALLTYPREMKEGGTKVYTHNWVVAKPFGYGAVARVAITLRVPEGQQSSPEVTALMEQLDKQVGDAVIPQA
jgi:hypothetical protein